MTEEDDEDQGVQVGLRVARVLEALTGTRDALSRLHPVERMIVEDLTHLPQKRRCTGCLKLVLALYEKGVGHPYREETQDEVPRSDRT